VAVCGSDVGQVVVIVTSTNQLDIRSQLNFPKKKSSHKQYCSFSQYFIFAIEINVTKIFMHEIRCVYRALKIVSEIIL
jgi:hypothetical protein